MVYHGSRVSSILIRFKVRVAYGPKYVSDALAKEKKMKINLQEHRRQNIWKIPQVEQSHQKYCNANN